MEERPSALLQLLGGSGGSLGLPGHGAHCPACPGGHSEVADASHASAGGSGGSPSEPVRSPDVSSGFRLRAFSACMRPPAAADAACSASALDSLTCGISSSELQDVSSCQPVRSSLQQLAALRPFFACKHPAPYPCEPQMIHDVHPSVYPGISGDAYEAFRRFWGMAPPALAVRGEQLHQR